MDSLERNDQPHTPTEVARAGWQHTGARRGRALIYAAVAVISLAVGIGSTWYVLGGSKGAVPDGSSGAAPAAGAAEHAGHGGGGTAPAGTGTEGAAKAVYISPARQQLIGVRTADVTHHALETTIRTTGVIVFDETKVAQIHTKVAGWLNTVTANAIGEQLRKGQPLFTLYSPDLVATQREYLLALKAADQLGNSQVEETRAGAKSLLSATRERLRLWDVTDAQIEELTRTGEPRKYVTVYAPAYGVITERNAFVGQYITPDAGAYTVTNVRGSPVRVSSSICASVTSHRRRRSRVADSSDVAPARVSSTWLLPS